jgi:hypothetical protein
MVERQIIESREMSSSVPIPKFTSFRPKAVDGDVPKSEKPSEGSEPGDLEGRERKHHHRRHRSRSQERTPKRVVDERLPVQATANNSGELFVEVSIDTASQPFIELEPEVFLVQNQVSKSREALSKTKTSFSTIEETKRGANERNTLLHATRRKPPDY